MTLDTIKQAVGVARGQAESRGQRSLGVIFFGGEPLLRKDLIIEAMRYCRGLGNGSGISYHFKVTTNGLLLGEAFLSDPDTDGLFVALSHDGVREAHDRHRVGPGESGSFDRLDATIDLLLRHRPYAPVMLVTTPETVEHYADSVEFLYGRGFRYLICSLNYAGAWDERAIRELRRQYRRLAQWYERETRREAKFYFSPFEVKIGSHIRPGSCKSDRCELGQRQISVGPDGTFYPCVQFVGDPDYAIGHASTGIDEEARARLYIQNAAEKETCAACAIRERCNHYCGCLNRQATGSIDTVSPVLCAHERTVLPIADRLGERLFKRRDAMFIQKHYNDLFPLISLMEDRSAGRSQ